MKKKGTLIVISGFSGAGKGSIVNGLLAKYDNYALSVSATSRNPREGEKNGVHYFFKSREEFEEMIKNSELIEYTEYVGNYYGTPKKYVEDKLAQGNNVILEIEVVGGTGIKKIYPDTLLIFVIPPSIKELKNRLKGRGTESESAIKNRLIQAKRELSYIDSYEYLIVNEDLDTAIEQIDMLIRQSDLRVCASKNVLYSISQELKELDI